MIHDICLNIKEILHNILYLLLSQLFLLKIKIKIKTLKNKLLCPHNFSKFLSQTSVQLLEFIAHKIVFQGKDWDLELASRKSMITLIGFLSPFLVGGGWGQSHFQ